MADHEKSVRVELIREPSGRRVARVARLPQGKCMEAPVDPSLPLLPQVKDLVAEVLAPETPSPAP